MLMRVYGEIAQRSDYMLRNSVIFALFSEKKKGPKLYGMYPEGRIEEFIPVSIYIYIYIFFLKSYVLVIYDEFLTIIFFLCKNSIF